MLSGIRSAAADADWQYRARLAHEAAGTLPPIYREAGWPATAPGRVASRYGLTYFDAEWLELSKREQYALAEENAGARGQRVFRIAERLPRGYYRHTRQMMPKEDAR